MRNSEEEVEPPIGSMCEGSAGGPDRPTEPVEGLSAEDHAHGKALSGECNPSVSNADGAIMTMGIMG